MNNKEFEEYLNEISKYTEKVSKKEVQPKDSLESLVKAGICNENKKINSMYRLV